MKRKENKRAEAPKPDRRVPEMTEAERRERIRRAAADFAVRFEDVMRRLSKS